VLDGKAIEMDVAIIAVVVVGDDRVAKILRPGDRAVLIAVNRHILDRHAAGADHETVGHGPAEAAVQVPIGHRWAEDYAAATLALNRQTLADEDVRLMILPVRDGNDMPR